MKSVSRFLLKTSSLSPSIDNYTPPAEIPAVGEQEHRTGSE